MQAARRAQQQQTKGPSTWFTADKNTNDDLNSALVVTQQNQNSKPVKTHAQKLAATYEQEQRREKQKKLVLATKNEHGLPGGAVNTYRQRLGNIRAVERDLDKQLNRKKPNFKDHRSDLLLDDLRKCNPGAGN